MGNAVSLRLEGINQALNSGLVLRASLCKPGNQRVVTIFDPREEGECCAEVLGSADAFCLELSLFYASESFLNGGKRMNPVWMSCGLLGENPTFCDRFLVAGGSLRAHHKNGETRITARNYHGNNIISFSSPDFERALEVGEHTFKQRPTLIEAVYESVPDSQRKAYALSA